MISRKRRPRVFIGLGEIAGYYSGLVRGLRDIGIDARFVDVSADPSAYEKGSVTRAVKSRASSLLWPRPLRRAVKSMMRLAIFPWAVLRFDVFIFNGPDSFLGYRDLPVLKALGKKVIYVFNGSDHRPPYLNGKYVRYTGTHEPGWLAAETLKVKKRVRTVERYADAIVALAPSAQLHTRPFVDFLQVGIPCFPADTPDGASPRSIFGAADSPYALRVLHCPSHPETKGTTVVRTAIAKLRASGCSIDYREMTGRSHAEVVDALRACDFVVDQVWSDTPMAGLAAEAGFYGKPAIVGSYVVPNEQKHVGSVDQDLPPTLLCHPDDLEEAVRRLVDDPEYRRDLGERARAFVRSNWAPSRVAERFLRLTSGDVPSEWLRDPHAVRYTHGYGMPESLVREGIQAVLTAAGRRGLEVSHNADLEDRLVLVAESEQRVATAEEPPR